LLNTAIVDNENNALVSV